MKLTPQTLTQHLKQTPGDFYCVTGKEPVLIDQTIQDLLTSMKQRAQASATPLEKTNLWIESSKDWSSCFSNMQHYGLFANLNIIHVRYEKTNLDLETLKKLQTSFEERTPGTVFLLQAPALKATSFLNTLARSPTLHHIDCPRMNDATYRRYLLQQCEQAALNVAPQVPALLAQLTQGHLAQAVQCIRQLSLLSRPGEVIDERVLTQLLGDESLFPIYQWCDSCLQGDLASMMQQFNRLRQLNTEPILMLWWLTKLIRQLCSLHEQASRPEPISDHLWQTLGIWQHQKKIFLHALKKFTMKDLLTLLQRCQSLDVQLKTYQAQRAWDQLEVIALQLNQPNLRMSS